MTGWHFSIKSRTSGSAAGHFHFILDWVRKERRNTRDFYLARTIVTPVLSLMPNSRLRSCKAGRQVNTDKHNMSDSVVLGTITNMQNGYKTNVA